MRGRKERFKSHLLQMRGLKLEMGLHDGDVERVASFTDAWIETQIKEILEGRHKSHLLQMRGLKLTFANLQKKTYSRIFYRCVD